MSHNYGGMFGRTDTDNNTTTRNPHAKTGRWSLGEHSFRPQVDADDLRADAANFSGLDDELADLFETAAARVPNMDLYDFECPVCGLSHGHDDTKHDLRGDPEHTPGFNLSQEFAGLMEFDPICHCGVNELAMLVEFHDHIDVPLFSDRHELSSDELTERFDAIRAAADGADIGAATESRIETIRAMLHDEFGDPNADDTTDDEPEDGDDGLGSLFG